MMIKNFTSMWHKTPHGDYIVVHSVLGRYDKNIIYDSDSHTAKVLDKHN
jgi:hypothetical protein